MLNQIWPTLSPLINLFTAAEAGQQDADRRQGDQALRHSANPLPAAASPP